MATSILNTNYLNFQNAGADQCKLTGSASVLTFSGVAGAAVELKNIATPTTDNSCVNKAYADSLSQGAHWLDSCRVRSDTNINISSAPASIDGVALSNGDRVLLFNQSTATEDGIYVFNGAASAMTRSDDFQSGQNVAGHATFIQEGTYDNSGWICTNDSGSDVVGTDDLNFARFSGLSDVTAGDGLSKTGAVLDVNVGQGLEIASDNVQIQNLSVVAGMLAADSVETDKIVDANVTANKLATDSVQTAKIVDNAVTTVKILDANVTTAKIADNNVTTAKILDANVTNAKLLNDEVTITAGDGLQNGGAVALGSSVSVAVDSSVLRTTNNFSASGVFSFTNNTASTSTSTGAVIVTGGVGIGEKLYVSSDAYANSFNTTSDKRLKSNIEDIKDYNIDNVRPVSFYWNDKSKSDAKQYGVIAQELDQQYPDLVDKSSEYLSVNYQGLIPLLVKEVQDLKKKVKELENK